MGEKESDCDSTSSERKKLTLLDKFKKEHDFLNYNVNEIIEAKGNAVGLKPEDSIKDISDLEDSNYGSTFKKSEPSLSAKEHDNECVASEEENKSNRLIKTVSKSDDNESSSEGNRVYNLNEEAYLTKYYEPTHCGSGCLMS